MNVSVVGYQKLSGNSGTEESVAGPTGRNDGVTNDCRSVSPSPCRTSSRTHKQIFEDFENEPIKKRPTGGDMCKTQRGRHLARGAIPVHETHCWSVPLEHESTARTSMKTMALPSWPMS